jgi:PhoPQ-activated pathogenicity-related protein
MARMFFPMGSPLLSRVPPVIRRSVVCACAGLASVAAYGGALEDYVRKADDSFAWKVTDRQVSRDSTVVRMEMTSQQWREHPWTHHLVVVRPEKVRNPDIALLFVTGDGDGRRYVKVLEILAESAGAVAAVITRIPNQPLYGNRKEDALIAYTFDQYTKTGDPTWPLLFPMVKSAVRGMDAVGGVARQEFDQELKRFVVTGASKRGWTTWLTGAVDRRVAAIAPMVIDMLNMPAQLDWAARAYGKQSEQISDYTELNMHERMDEPRMVELRGWVDPYSYRRSYTMPKLLLLGTNDRYWVVDALRHYWNDLPDPKLLFQTPNAGHDLAGGREAIGTLAAFFQMIADGEELPRVAWSHRGGVLEPLTLDVTSTQPLKAARLWTADSADRDLRDDKWKSRRLWLRGDHRDLTADLALPGKGYRAAMIEVELKTQAGHRYKLSSEVLVTPDLLPGEQLTAENARPPASDEDLRYWLGNMAQHGFSLEEMHAATGLGADALQSALRRFDLKPGRNTKPQAGEPLLVLPYPGGRHPRIGFRDGAVDPQRETKVSVFTPWKYGGYVVVDVPEAIWHQHGLLYLAHTHVPTIWSKQDVELPKLEWNRRPDGTLDFERRLPNHVTFGARIVPGREGVRMELWLHNGSNERLTDLRVQNCVMLREAKGFTAQSNGNKNLSAPFAACRSDDGHRWIITAWEPCHRPWANPPCPCLHSDPKFPDLAPGETGRLRGWLSFHEGADVEAAFESIRASGWLDAGRNRAATGAVR